MACDPTQSISVFFEIKSITDYSISSLRERHKKIKRDQKGSKGIKRDQKGSKGIKRDQKGSKGIKRDQKPDSLHAFKSHADHIIIFLIRSH